MRSVTLPTIFLSGYFWFKIKFMQPYFDALFDFFVPSSFPDK